MTHQLTGLGGNTQCKEIKYNKIPQGIVSVINVGGMFMLLSMLLMLKFFYSYKLCTTILAWPPTVSF